MNENQSFEPFGGSVLEQPSLQPEEFSLESVVGTDERKRVKNTGVRPFRMIVRLKSQFPNLPVRYATGFLIDKWTVLTCAHALCQKVANGVLVQAETVFAAAAAAGVGQYPYEDLPSGEIRVASKYLQKQDPLFDYGVVRLPTDLGSRVGWFGRRTLSSPNIPAAELNLFGYPDAEPAKPPRLAIPAETMWGMSGVANVTEFHLTYEMDTNFGQSGSPVYDDDNYCYGIHVSGTYAQNYALRFRKDINDEIRSWTS